jgi:ABC-type multidrug transport system ATPase subunit
MTEFAVKLEKVAKRYDREWIIRDFNQELVAGMCYGISGRNGAGKSTLLRLMSGHLSPTRGRISFTRNGKAMKPAEVYPLLSYVGPYMDVIEELTLEEAIDFHFRFKRLRPGLSKAELPQEQGLDRWKQRPIKTYSSGMKQRVLLGLALFSDTPLLLLDEPTTTLDTAAQAWFQEKLAQHKTGRLVVIATNVKDDLAQCQEVIRIE